MQSVSEKAGKTNERPIQNQMDGRELDDRTDDEFPKRQPIPVPDLEFQRNALERLELV